ncbi:MAG: hypothetical protein R3D28_12140 [Geminicoccaceae bacterium]
MVAKIVQGDVEDDRHRRLPDRQIAGHLGRGLGSRHDPGAHEADLGRALDREEVGALEMPVEGVDAGAQARGVDHDLDPAPGRIVGVQRQLAGEALEGAEGAAVAEMAVGELDLRVTRVEGEDLLGRDGARGQQEGGEREAAAGER